MKLCQLLTLSTSLHTHQPFVCNTKDKMLAAHVNTYFYKLTVFYFTRFFSYFIHSFYRPRPPILLPQASEQFAWWLNRLCEDHFAFFAFSLSSYIYVPLEIYSEGKEFRVAGPAVLAEYKCYVTFVSSQTSAANRASFRASAFAPQGTVTRKIPGIKVPLVL